MNQNLKKFYFFKDQRFVWSENGKNRFLDKSRSRFYIWFKKSWWFTKIPNSIAGNFIRVCCKKSNLFHISLKHPSIFATEILALQPHGSFILRRCAINGSIKDVINESKPKINFMKKISNKNFDLNTIRSVGYEILNTLKFLHRDHS